MPSTPITTRGRVAADEANFAAAARSPQLKGRIDAMLERMVDLYEWIMDYGTREEQTALMKSSLPGIVKGVETAKQEEAQTQMAASYERLRGLFASRIHNPVVVPVADDDDDADDGPGDAQ